MASKSDSKFLDLLCIVCNIHTESDRVLDSEAKASYSLLDYDFKFSSEPRHEKLALCAWMHGCLVPSGLPLDKR